MAAAIVVFVGFAPDVLPARELPVHAPCRRSCACTDSSSRRGSRSSSHRRRSSRCVGRTCIGGLVGRARCWRWRWSSSARTRVSQPCAARFPAERRCGAELPHDAALFDGGVCGARAAAIRLRRDPQTHKRLMLLATISILDAAVARLPFAFLRSSTWNYIPTTDVFLVAAILYDVASRRPCIGPTSGAVCCSSSSRRSGFRWARPKRGRRSRARSSAEGRRERSALYGLRQRPSAPARTTGLPPRAKRHRSAPPTTTCQASGRIAPDRDRKLGPQTRFVRGLDQPRRDSQALAVAPHGALEQMAGLQCFGNVARALRRALERHR